MLKKCIVCSSEYAANKYAASRQKYCSDGCNRTAWNARHPDNVRKNTSTEQQYRRRSNSWRSYYQHLRAKRLRGSQVTIDEIMQLHNYQGGRCALTGVVLTNSLSRGVRSLTNASLDRKVAGGSYVIENIQIVCVAVNRFRVDLSIDEFIEWCRLVVGYTDQAARDRADKQPGGEAMPQPASKVEDVK